MLAKRKDTAFCCQEYADCLMHEKCEVTHLLLQDEGFRDWSRKGHFLQKMDVHHIYGRSKKPESNYWSNLIRISSQVHTWGHDVYPFGLEVCCWLAKFEKHQNVIERLHMMNRPVPCSENLDWHVETLDRVVEPFDGIRGRVEYLADQCRGNTVERLARKLLGLMNE